MPTEVLMPALSPTMEEGTLAKWLVAEGDTVSSGDLLAEIETDKATMEFESVDDGVVGKLLVRDGTAGVKVNTPIAILLAEDESKADIETNQDGPQHGRSEDVGENPEDEAGGMDEAKRLPSTSRDRSASGRIFASPLARRMAKENGLDLADIKGSGPHGRIVKSDVQSMEVRPKLQTPADSRPETLVTGASADAVLKLYEDREFEEIELDGMRKTIAGRLVEAKQTIPHFYLRRDILLDALIALRSDLNNRLETRGIKLSVNDFIIKACALALQRVPDANAVWAGDRILRLKPSDVAVAVAVDGGLYTPVIRDAEMKSLSALSTQIKSLVARAHERKLKPQEYQGGSFSVSNLGMFGVDSFDAVINPPHGAILAVGAAGKKAIVSDNGELIAATTMSVTLSVDHRVIDGALGAKLLAEIKGYLEDPMAMLA